ncbi:MAG: glycosyltransferase [Desulfuromonadales bacterium]|nr:glycosyltransferase [Desulfuromonadales bacterium]
MSSCLVSIIIPAYNAALFLPATLASIQEQAFRNVETIVVDDGSTDETRLLIRQRQGSDLRLIALEHSGGPARPRNAGIRAASGRYIALFDADDVMLPGKLQEAVHALEAMPEVDAVCSDFQQIDESGALLKNRSLQEYRMFRQALVPTPVAGAQLVQVDRLYLELLRANFIATSSVVFRRELLEEIGFFDESLSNADDIDLWLRLARARRRLVFLERPGHQYRRRRQSISTGGVRRFPSVLRVLEKQRHYPLSAEEKGVLEQRIWTNQVSYAWALKRSGAYEESFRLYRQSLQLGVSPRLVKGLLHAGACLLLRRAGGGQPV